MSQLPTVVIIGRRNVGKSALFNRLIEEQKAIVSDIAGTTRDRTEAVCLWRGVKIRVVDTGGLDVADTDTIDREVKKQARFAMKKADLILFLMDVRVGPMNVEETLAKELRATKKPILLVANKAETQRYRDAAENPTWKRLGFGLPFPISAITGQGVGDLLDLIFAQLTTTKSFTVETPHPKPDLSISIIGKPNVGKSSLLNKLLGEERVIVSPIPHTTREPQDTLLTILDPRPALMAPRSPIHILLIDTAGLRKKAKIKPGIEQMGIQKTIHTISRSQVVIFVLNLEEPIDAQDKQLAGFIEQQGVGVVIAANKWDLLETRASKKGDTLLKGLHFGLPGLSFASVVLTSATGGHNIHKLLPTCLHAHENRNRVVDEDALKALLPKLVKHHRPQRAIGNTRIAIIRRIEQVSTAPPTFAIIIGPKQSLHESYVRFVEHQLREYFDFEGTPIKIWVKQERN